MVHDFLFRMSLDNNYNCFSLIIMSFPRHLLKIYFVAPENIHTYPKKGYRKFQDEAISKAYIFLRRV